MIGKSFKWPDDIDERLKQIQEKIKENTGLELSQSQVILYLIRKEIRELEK